MILFYFFGQICRDYRLIDSSSFFTKKKIWNGWQTKLYRTKKEMSHEILAILNRKLSDFLSKCSFNRCDNNIFIIIRKNEINSNWLPFSRMMKSPVLEIQMMVYFLENCIIFAPLFFHFGMRRKCEFEMPVAPIKINSIKESNLTCLLAHTIHVLSFECNLSWNLVAHSNLI